MSRKRFFIGGVELVEGKHRDYFLHLIDLKEKTMRRFFYRDEVGRVVAALCSPSAAQAARQECLDERSEILNGGYLRCSVPVYGKNTLASLDNLDEVAALVQEHDPRALMFSRELGRLIREWENFYFKDENDQNIDVVDVLDNEQLFEESIECEAAFIPPLNDDDLGSGAIFNFEHDFTFDINDVPDDLREKYHIISFETAQVTALQFTTVKNCIYHALEDAGIRTSEHKEVVPAGVTDCGDQDDAFVTEKNRLIEA